MKPLLADRLIEFGGRVCVLTRRPPRDVALENAFRQLARAATSPAANYAEAREAVSTRDYVHRMKTCAKELRESLAWLQIAQRAGYRSGELPELVQECRELLAITLTCIRRAESR
jgi:four helix bundle protein